MKNCKFDPLSKVSKIHGFGNNGKRWTTNFCMHARHLNSLKTVRDSLAYPSCPLGINACIWGRTCLGVFCFYSDFIPFDIGSNRFLMASLVRYAEGFDMILNGLSLLMHVSLSHLILVLMKWTERGWLGEWLSRIQDLPPITDNTYDWVDWVRKRSYHNFKGP